MEKEKGKKREIVGRYIKKKINPERQPFNLILFLIICVIYLCYSVIEVK